MAIDGVGIDEPFHISSSGSNDEGRIRHDGTDLLIDNDTGKTKLGDKGSYQFEFDHANERLGIGITPFYTIHIDRASATQIRVNNSAGAEFKINAAATSIQMGSVSNHELRFYTTNINRGEIDTGGNITIPAAYTTVISGTNVDLYIDSTGKIGPLPSFLDLKENIRPLTDQDTSWIYNIPVKMCDYTDGTLNQITVIAEDAELVRPDVIRYTPFEITEAGPVLINRSEYKGLENIRELISPGEEKEIELDGIVIDANGDETIEKITKMVKLHPFTTNKSDFIYPLVKELQKKNLAIENLLSRVNALELIAGITSITIPETIKKKGLFSRKSKK